MLHVDSVIMSFESRQLLTDVFLECKRGEIVGLFGRNGTGKSCLLKIIFGSLAADTSFVKIDDTVLDSLFKSRRLIKYLPQTNFLPNHVRIDLIINLFCRKNNMTFIKELDFIEPLLFKKVNQLSGGEKRLLEVFLVIFSESEFALIDEPFNGVAPLMKEEIKHSIKRESKNKGFIITDHDYESILEISDRIIVIHDGGTKEIKSRDELVDLGYISGNS